MNRSALGLPDLLVITLLAGGLAAGCGSPGGSGTDGGSGDASVGQLPGPDFPLDPSETTLVQTLQPVVPAVNPTDPTHVPPATEAKFGELAPGPGEPFTFRNDLGIAGATDTVPAGARSLLYFPVITDIHITDSRSPLRFCSADARGTFQGAYRPQDRYTTQVLDATVRTLDDFSVTRHYDLLLALGDTIDNTSTDEVRWFIDTLDGGVIHPDSGDHVDVVPGPLNDPHDPFQAFGLDPKVPWYTTLGNHDDQIAGNFFVTDEMQGLATGDTVYLGSEDAKGDILPAGAKVKADPARALLGVAGYLEAFFTTTSKPVGHGFTQANLDSGHGDYVIRPVPSLPLEILVLDWECRNQGSADGCVSQDEYDNFLVPQLEAAKQAHDLVIVASHQSTWALNPDLTEVKGTQVQSLFESYPNVVLHLVGHGHDNVVLAHPGPSASAPGYWEIETSSLVDYPQQSRILEIVDNGDGTGEIFATLVDHNSPDGSLSATSRSLSLQDIQDGSNTSGAEGSAADRNVELAFAIPPDVEAALKAVSRPTKIESLTTLEGN